MNEFGAIMLMLWLTMCWVVLGLIMFVAVASTITFFSKSTVSGVKSWMWGLIRSRNVRKFWGINLEHLAERRAIHDGRRALRTERRHIIRHDRRSIRLGHGWPIKIEF